MKMNHALLILTGALLLGGCSSTTVSYGDPTETETVTESDTDLPRMTGDDRVKLS